MHAALPSPVGVHTRKGTETPGAASPSEPRGARTGPPPSLSVLRLPAVPTLRAFPPAGRTARPRQRCFPPGVAVLSGVTDGARGVCARTDRHGPFVRISPSRSRRVCVAVWGSPGLASHQRSFLHCCYPCVARVWLWGPSVLPVCPHRVFDLGVIVPVWPSPPHAASSSDFPDFDDVPDSYVPLSSDTSVAIEGCADPVTVAELEVRPRAPPPVSASVHARECVTRSPCWLLPPPCAVGSGRGRRRSSRTT